MTAVVVAIAGGSGSGKSTVARRLADALADVRTAFVDMDAYYRNMTHLTAEQRRHVNWDHPSAFDWQLFVQHLETLVAGGSVEKPVYDFTTHSRAADTVPLGPADVVIVDGLLLLFDVKVRKLCDIKIFVDTDADIRLVRRIRRDLRMRARPLEEILEQYLSTVRPMHREFVEPSRRFADLVLLHGGRNDVALEMILATVRRQLGAVTP